MATEYPFPIPDSVLHRLPAPGPEGLRALDVKVRDRWDGILLVNAEGVCIGIRVCRSIEQHPLPFDPALIEDVRPVCLRNRLLAE